MDKQTLTYYSSILAIVLILFFVIFYLNVDLSTSHVFLAIFVFWPTTKYLLRKVIYR